MQLGGLAAGVVGVIFDETFDLPGRHPNISESIGERFRRIAEPVLPVAPVTSAGSVNVFDILGLFFVPDDFEATA